MIQQSVASTARWLASSHVIWPIHMVFWQSFMLHHCQEWQPSYTFWAHYNIVPFTYFLTSTNTSQFLRRIIDFLIFHPPDWLPDSFSGSLAKQFYVSVLNIYYYLFLCYMVGRALYYVAYMLAFVRHLYILSL